MYTSGLAIGIVIIASRHRLIRQGHYRVKTALFVVAVGTMVVGRLVEFPLVVLVCPTIVLAM